MKILHLFRKIKKSFSKHDHAIQVLLSRSNLLHNFYEFKNKYPDFLFTPVLKSNAYGHGLLEIAQILEKEKSIPFFVVDSIFEARVLIHNSIKKDILIIGYTRLQNILNYNSKRFIFNIISLKELENLSQNISKKVRIHIKIDTGMHRHGILKEEISEAIDLIKRNKYFILEGISSHFADADSGDKSFTEMQLNNWREVVNIFKKEFTDMPFIHISATSGVSFLDKEFANLVRLGIGLYGINVSHDKDLDLRSVMRVESIISSIKDLKAGEHIGYSHTHALSRDSRVATVPIGYFEGLDRRLSNTGYLKVKDSFCKILGRVSMNIASIDISDIKDIKLEDKVIVISELRGDKNSLENISDLCHTIPYEIMVHIAPHLKRKVVEEFNN